MMIEELKTVQILRFTSQNGIVISHLCLRAGKFAPLKSINKQSIFRASTFMAEILSIFGDTATRHLTIRHVFFEPN